MLIRAKVTFAGNSLSMFQGETKDLERSSEIEALLECGYVELVEGADKTNEGKRNNASKGRKPAKA